MNSETVSKPSCHFRHLSILLGLRCTDLSSLLANVGGKVSPGSHQWSEQLGLRIGENFLSTMLSEIVLVSIRSLSGLFRATKMDEK